MVNISEIIGENRDRVKRNERRPVQIGPEGGFAADVGTVRLEFDVDVIERERDVQSQIIINNNNSEIGRDVMNDVRGQWVEREIYEGVGKLTVSGQSFIVSRFNANDESSVGKFGIGTGDRAVTGFDASLEEFERDLLFYGSTVDDGSVFKSESLLSTDELEKIFTEINIIDGEGEGLTRAVWDGDGRSLNRETRYDVRLRSTSTDSFASITEEEYVPQVITEDGQGIDEMNFGDGEPDSSGLNNELVRNPVTNEYLGRRIITESVILPSEPENQPVDITEVGLVNGDGDTFIVFNVDAAKKTDEYMMSGFVKILIR